MNWLQTNNLQKMSVKAEIKKDAVAKTSTPSLASQSKSQAVNIQEFAIRIPRNLRKSHHVMQFNATLNIDFAQWKNAKMERENNMRDLRNIDEEVPKFGAGSEFNREQREEARRKRLGINARKYKADAQPWILKVGGKSGKKFRGNREGGVGENVAYYVFTHAPDGAIEAYPLNEWYNFKPINRFKALSAEEADVEFNRRIQRYNYFSLMLQKRLKGEDEEREDPEEAKLKMARSKKGKELKISDMDEWMDSDDDDSNSSGEEGDEEGKKKKKDGEESDDGAKKKKGKKNQPEKKKKKRDLDGEAFEESDDGDEEGRELDYISDSSEPDSDLESKANKEMKSVAEEDALRNLLTSEDESEDDKNSDDQSENEDEKNTKEWKEKENKDKKKKKKLKKKPDDKKESLSDFSSDSSDSNADEKPPQKPKKPINSGPSSRSASPGLLLLEGSTSSNPNKRKLVSMPVDLASCSNSNGGHSMGSENSNSPTVTPAKRTKIDAPTLPVSFSGILSSNKDDYGITEEAVRRYLMRKPMTTTELLQKFKNKKTGVSSEKLVETMTQILKKINPVKQTIQGKMYLSIKINK